VISCTQLGCDGVIEDDTGFCDTCGLRARPGPESATTSSSTPGWAGGTGSKRRRFGRRASDSLIPLPYLAPPDPRKRVRTDPKPPDKGRPCGKDGCREQVGVGYAGQPPLTSGYCPRCGTFYSFEPTLRAGDLVADQYKIVGCLDHGGLGWVYLATDDHLDGNYVVLKGLINANDSHALETAVNERRFLRTLEHPDIVRIYNFVTHPDPRSGELIGYIVMGYVGGLSLQQIKDDALRGQGSLEEPLRLEHVVTYGIRILGALEYLHEQNLLYCDMKPDNVIHRKKGIKLIDLGAVRRIDDRDTPIVGTRRYLVSDKEIKARGLSVQSDIYTVGKTLSAMYPATTDWTEANAEGMWRSPIGFGIDSFQRAVRHATAEDPDQRFASAADMAEQLRGILREIRSLRDGEQNPEPSTVFAPTAVLLDAGLGTVPPLERWTAPGAGPPAESGEGLAIGRPAPAAVAAGLPVPLVDQDDPAADYLAEASVLDPQRRIDKLATTRQELAQAGQPDSVEVELSDCRAHIELADLDGARESLRTAEKLFGRHAKRDWRLSWHRGLLAVAEGRAAQAEAEFDEVYGRLPGEAAPKLALGFCAEWRNELDRAKRCYEVVWLRDQSHVSAAFGLARVHLANADRQGAVSILDTVPELSRHYDSARIAAVRVIFERFGRELPTPADFGEVERRLPALYLDGGETDGPSRIRLMVAILETALVWVRTTGGAELAGGPAILGDRPTERSLRRHLEDLLRRLAGQAGTEDEHGVLVDLANAVRPLSLW
jgi:serine/threonine-protein kinase PknG